MSRGCKYPECRHRSLPKEDYCIFHLPIEKKPEGSEMAERFQRDFQALCRHRDYVWKGFRFPSGIGLHRETIVISLDLRSAVIHGSVNFSNIEVWGKIDFTGANIYGKVTFMNVDIYGEVKFLDANINGDVGFSGAKIRGGINFSCADIFGEIKLVGETKVTGMLKFAVARIFKGVSFQSPKLFGGLDFMLAEIYKDIVFFYAEIYKKADFRKMVLFGEGFFVETKFFSSCDFSYIQGRQIALMDKTDSQLAFLDDNLRLYEPVPPMLDFEETKFCAKEEATESCAEEREADTEARFLRVDLSRTRFYGVDLSKVSFLYSQIHQTRFIDCEWEGSAESWSITSRKCPFWRWRRRHVLWDELKWRKGWPKERDKERDKERISSRNDTRDSLPSSSPDYSGEHLRWINLRLLAKQRDKPKKFWSDELPPSQVQLSAEEIKKLALQLKQSLEESKDPITAGEFHFLAMEMRRAKAIKEGRRYRAAALWIYKILNGYGERPLRAFVLWGLGVLLFGFFFALLGAWRQWYVPLGFWESLEPALRHAIHHAFPFRVGLEELPSAIEKVTIAGPRWFWWLSHLETILLSAQFTFFVLALRRRFKR